MGAGTKTGHSAIKKYKQLHILLQGGIYNMMKRNIALLSDEELNAIENTKMNIEVDENLEESMALLPAALLLAALAAAQKAY